MTSVRKTFRSFSFYFFFLAFALSVFNLPFYAQQYTITVNDILGSVDSAAVTFGDSTKYTDENGIVRFF